MITKLRLSTRAYSRALKVGGTIADLAGTKKSSLLTSNARARYELTPEIGYTTTQQRQYDGY
jgi:predicted ATPase with chaperone activity